MSDDSASDKKARCVVCDALFAPFWALGVVIFPFFRWNLPDYRRESWVLIVAFWMTIALVSALFVWW